MGTESEVEGSIQYKIQFSSLGNWGMSSSLGRRVGVGQKGRQESPSLCGLESPRQPYLEEISNRKVER